MATHTITLSWTASTDNVNGYNVYQGTTPGSESATPDNGTTLVTGTTYVATVPSPGEYSFYVTSVENGAESVHSGEITAKVLPFPPSALQVTAIN